MNQVRVNRREQGGRLRGSSTRNRSSSNGELKLGRRHKPDYVLLLLSIALLAIGVVVIYAIGPALAETHGSSPNFYINRQLIAIALSLVVFLIVSNIPLASWKRLQKPLFIAAAVVTLLAIIMPVSPEYPAHRWVKLGGFSFQSVELLKFAVLIGLASFLGRIMQRDSSFNLRRVFKPLIAVILVIGAVVAGVQSDLGSAGVMMAMAAAMAYTAGLPMKRILTFVGIIFIGAILLTVTSGYRRDRVATFLNPERDCQDVGYQACHAHIAVGSGGIIGQGLGRGAQAYGYLPEAENDAIFAIYAEKFGFVGVSILIGIFIGFFSRMRRIAERVADPFSRLIVVGVLTWLSVQAIMNMGAMLGLLPLKGITLPLVSYGGTSVVFIVAAIGLVFQISRHTSHRTSNAITNKGGSYENRHDRRRIRRAHHPNSSGR